MELCPGIKVLLGWSLGAYFHTMVVCMDPPRYESSRCDMRIVVRACLGPHSGAFRVSPALQGPSKVFGTVRGHSDS